jgi:hypothetical protein
LKHENYKTPIGKESGVGESSKWRKKV